MELLLPIQLLPNSTKFGAGTSFGGSGGGGGPARLAGGQWRWQAAAGRKPPAFSALGKGGGKGAIGTKGARPQLAAPTNIETHADNVYRVEMLWSVEFTYSLY